MTTTGDTTREPITTGERADLLEALRTQRAFLLHTVRGLDEEAVRRTPTVSALSLASLLKHVAATEAQWADFVVSGPSAMAWAEVDWSDPAVADAPRPDFQVAADETLADLVAEYERVAARTDELVATLPDLGVSHPLPDAPWFPPGTTRSARRVLAHVVAETAQHCGHADILRETIDGQRTMG